MNLLKHVSDTRGSVYSILLGVWAIVAIYAMAHDQYLVRISPEHFTEFHEPLWGISDPGRLALAYAFLASISPGSCLGVAAWLVARTGPLPKLASKVVLWRAIGLVIAVEIVAVAIGLIAHRTHRPVFPESWYPDESPPLIVTQTIQIACYLFGFLFSGIYLTSLWIQRLGLRGCLRIPIH